MTAHPLSGPKLDDTRPPLGDLVRLAWPITVSMLSYSAMTLVDTLFVARLGAAALAGVSLGGIFAFTLICLGFGGLRAVKVLVSQARGAGRHDRVGRMIAAGLWVALGVGLLTGLAGVLSAGVLHLVAASEASGQAAAEYAIVRSLGAPAVLVGVALREGSYGLGDAQSPMRAALVANACNTALCYALVFGLGLGVLGAASATVTAQTLECLLLARKRRDGLRALFSVRRRDLAAVTRLGWPIGIQFLLEVGAFAVLTGIFASMGENAAGAHQIVIQVLHFAFLPAFALGEAGSVLVGEAVGAGRVARVGPVTRTTLLVAEGYALCCGAVLWLGAEVLARAFTDDAELVATIVPLFQLAALFQFFDAANIVARSILRGAGDVRFAAVAGAICAWGLTPPLALALGYGLGLGVMGGWLGLTAEVVLSTVVLWWRFAGGSWRLHAARAQEALAAEPISVLEPVLG